MRSVTYDTAPNLQRRTSGNADNSPYFARNPQIALPDWVFEEKTVVEGELGLIPT